LKFPRLRFVVPFIAALLLTGYGEVASKWEQDQRIARLTWKAACELSRYSCKRLDVPTVRRSGMLGDIRARGAYWGGSPIIWLDWPLKGTQMWLTTFHEQIHYLQWHNRAYDGNSSRLLDCVIEREAWRLTNEYVDYLKAPQTFKRSLEDWKRLYDCDANQQNQIMGH
jgi:hypothetical protein